MRTRTLNCVAMKRRAAARVYQLTKDMTFQQKVDFWHQESEAFLAEQKDAKSRAGARRKQRSRAAGIRTTGSRR